MNRELLDKWLERGIVGFALLILVAMPLAFGGRPQPVTGSRLDFLLLNPFLFAQFCLVPLLLLWVIRLWVNERPRLLWPPIVWLVLAFTAYAIARYLTADIEYVARQELIRIAVYALVFFVVINNLHRQELTQLVAATLVFLGMAISFYAAYQYFTGSDRVWHVLKPYHNRGAGTYINPNHLGGFLEMVLPLGMALTIVSRVKPLGKIFLGYASLVVMVGLVVTLSRGAWFASMISMLVFFLILLFNRTYRLPSVIVLVLLLGAGAYFGPRSFHLKARFQQAYSGGKLDNESGGQEGVLRGAMPAYFDARLALWQPALRVWQDNLWWGAGPAHFDYRFPAYRPETMQLRPDRAHNDILNCLADWGIVGSAIVVGAWALLLFGIFKTWRYVRKNPRDIGGSTGSSKFAFVLGASIGLLAILLHSVVDFNMHIPANALVAVTLLALLSSNLRFATSEYWFGAGTWAKLLVTAVLLTAGGWLGWQGWRQASENAMLTRAAQSPIFSAAQIDFYKRAYAVEPANPQTCHLIAEGLRVNSAAGPENHEELAKEAQLWFERAMKLNPWDGDSAARYAWCLDWLNRQEESAPWLARAERLDPNGYMTMAFIGLHYVQCRNPAVAKPFFERSLRLKSQNIIARSYLQIVNAELKREAEKLAPMTPAPMNERK
jgi:O-antigen ligase